MNVKANLCTFIYFELHIASNFNRDLVFFSKIQGVVRSFFLATHENSPNANLPDRNLFTIGIYLE